MGRLENVVLYDFIRPKMKTQIDEITEGIYRFSTFIPEIAAPAGFTFNQYLIDAKEPLLFHCGPRTMFPLVSAALATIVPIERLHWIGLAMSRPTNAVR